MTSRHSIATQILWALMDSPKPLFLSEIVTALGGEYPGPYIMPTLVWLMEQGKIGAETRDKAGKGPKQARAYFFIQPDDLLQPTTCCDPLKNDAELTNAQKPG